MVLIDPFTGKKKMIKHYDSFLKKWIRSKNNIGTGAFGQVYICEPKPEYANDSECQINNPHSLLQHNTFSIRKIPIPKGDMRGTLIGNEIHIKEKFVHPHLIEKVCIYKNHKNYYVL